MEVKPGYKQIDIGVIPQEWTSCALKNISRAISSGKSKGKISVGKYPFYGSTGIIGYCDKFDYSGKRILVARVGENAGSLYEVDGYFSVSDNTLIVDLKDHDISSFAYAYLKYLNLNNLVFGSGQPLITGSQLKNVRIILPSKDEILQITEIITNMGIFIDSIECLITKKKLIKHGVMQELLTGKRRLPGFTGEWVTKNLGEIGEISGAGVDKTLNDNDIPVRLVNYMDICHKDFIYSKDLYHIVTAKEHQLLRCAVAKGDVFFTPSSETRKDIGLSAVAMEDIPDAVYSYHVVRFRPYDDWETRFRKYIFDTKYFLDQAETLCEGSGKRYVVTLTKFRKMTLKYPIDVKEQEAISDVIFEIDKEIHALEKKRDKYKLIKQGMMQELLTGRIRLV